MCLGGALTSGHYHSFLLEREQKLSDKDLTFGGNSDSDLEKTSILI